MDLLITKEIMMKKTLTTALLSLTAALLYAEEPIGVPSPSANELSLPKAPRVAEKTLPGKSFLYLRMSAADSHPTDSFQIIPGIGLGYRLSGGNSAFDLSVNYTQGKGVNGTHRAYFYTVPKASYLHYFNPLSDQSFYGGVGLAWGGLKTKDERKFTGLIPSATLGLEMNRKKNWASFVQLDVSQPAVAATVTKPFPGPIAEVSVGAGF